MSQRISIKICQTSVSAKVAAYAAGAAAVLGGTATARSAIIYVDPPDISIPRNSNGIYLNLVTNAIGQSANSLPGYDLNVYGTDSFIYFFAPFDGGAGVVATTSDGNATALRAGTTIGPASGYRTGVSYGQNFNATGTEYLGVNFVNESTGITDYGWVRLSTTVGGGFPASILDYAYDSTGAPIVAGAVPEPGSLATLGTLALGASGLRAWRRQRRGV